MTTPRPLAALLFALALAPALPRAETAAELELPPASPPAALLDAYEEARVREDQAEAALQALRRLDTAVWDLTFATRRHARTLDSAQDAAKDRKDSLERAAKAAREAQAAKQTALAALPRYLQASHDARQAAARYAAATEADRIELARAADAAAEARAQALAEAGQAVRTAAARTDALRGALGAIASRSDELGKEIAEMRKTADNLAQKSAALEEALRTTAGKVQLPARLKAEADDAAWNATRLFEAALLLPTRLQLQRDLTDDMNRARDREPASAQPLKAYHRATLHAVVEADATVYLASLHEASFATCVPKPACSAGLDTELATAQALRYQAMREAEARAAPAAELLGNTEPTLRLVEALDTLAAPDLPVLQAADADAEALQPKAEQLRTAVQGAVDQARQAYADAQKAADAAYLAAFGHPRVEMAEGLPTPAMAAPEFARDYSPKMAAPGFDVEAHAWEFFTALEGESKGYGAYTYVLFNHRTALVSPQVKQRYEALLNAILASTPHRTETPIPPKLLNLFCIPGKSAWLDASGRLELGGSDNAAPLDNYASSLAFAYLGIAGSGAVQSREILHQISYSPGPFLLTTLKPLPGLRSYSPMLFVDLSRFHPDTFAEIVRSYKAALVEKPPREQAIWEPTRLKWAVLTAYELATHLANVKAGIAGWLKAGEDQPTKTALR